MIARVLKAQKGFDRSNRSCKVGSPGNAFTAPANPPLIDRTKKCGAPLPFRY